MKHLKVVLCVAAVIPTTVSTARGDRARVTAAGRVIALKATDGTVLGASYFPAARPGPGVLLLHQANRDRKSWNDLAPRLAASGINTLTLDMRGHGESGGTPVDKQTPDERERVREQEPGDVETALQCLISQAGVDRDVIGVGGAGALGVIRAVDLARQHPAEVRSIALLSGETMRDGLEFLHQASQLPELFVMADDDEYPPTVEAMELLYITASSPSRKLVHYVAAQEAPWLWFEPFDIGRVPASGGHGTDLFRRHPELPGIVVDWFVTTLMTTPGHAPADTIASARILDRIRTPAGISGATKELLDARRRDPKAQLFPEITVSIIGNDHLRAGDPKLALEVFQLNLLAYPDSADAYTDVAEAYLADGQGDLARRHAEKALALLDAHSSPASSWSDTEPRRGVIRRTAQQILDKAGAIR